ncbi:MAG: Peptidase S46 [Ignavibacteria bacterium]|nr:MAG: Peptidase S46 [Ignavibacteria bacterium]KAF0155579.1 MAG: Peptidase S46 [Ignavibacteria bacterium]
MNFRWLKFKSIQFVVVLFALSFILGLIPPSQEEGMYPMSEIEKIDLKKAGLKLSNKEVYNPDGVSLVDALVNLSGCTGSFISEQGLIITNHHCVYSSIVRSSTAEKNYLDNGFHAAAKDEEIPSPGSTARIIESYQDVSEEVLSAIENIKDPLERTKALAAKTKSLAEAAANEKESIVADVSEMFTGKTYVLFRYRIIRDVRLVYAPPQSIGNFGGETDNWVWPRHTGDFALVRAYVAPDGKAVPYSKDNVPFKPKKFLRVNPQGVEEGDFTFILGYPGRTFRHRPAEFIKYQQDYMMPFVANLYQYAIKTMQDLSVGDKTKQLAFANRIKGLANTMKNYQGKLKGLKKLNLVEQKFEEEKQLQRFIDADQKLKQQYGNVFANIHRIYEEINSTAAADLWVRQINSFAPSVSLATFVLNYVEEIQKPDSERRQPFQEKNLKQTLAQLQNLKAGYNADFEKAMLMKMMLDASKHKQSARIAAVDYLLEGNGANLETIFKEFVDKSVLASQIMQKEYFESLLTKKPEEILGSGDQLFNFAAKIKLQIQASEKATQTNEGKLNKLYADLVTAKMIWKNTNMPAGQAGFIPDANSTLRLTYGYVKGYSPADAVYYEPFTSIDGIIEKGNTGEEDFAVPDKLRTLYEKKDFGKYVSNRTKKLPIALLYNMDTTGGNSGSPILDAYGNLIGVNFDRAYEATINDFAWNEAYSRSIGVDIRYVLWVLDKFSGAENILKEIAVN